MVPGVRVHGDQVTEVDVKLDDLFQVVPIPALLGVPVALKKMSGTGGDDSHIRSNIIVRFMGDPDDGMAPSEWQYGGRMGPAPPVVLARKDGVPFSRADWDAIDEYRTLCMEEAGEAEDGRDEVLKRMMSPHAFRKYLCDNSAEFPSALLSLRFPLGSTVVPEGLSVAELNGRQGVVAQFSRDRVGVRFPDLPDRGVTALRPERLTLASEPTLPEEPPLKRVDADQREARAKHLQQAEAATIARRFRDCLMQDTFPEFGDLHLFGVGAAYQTRAQEALAVWQGAVKTDMLTEEQMAEALVAGTVRPLFEDTARKLAKSKTPNATYASEIVKNNFAAMEWDDL